MMNPKLKLIFFLVFSHFIANECQALDVPPGKLKDFANKMASSKTLVAEFSQTTSVAATQTKKTLKGDLALMKGGYFRWQTLSPESSVLVSDSKTFWFYTPPFQDGERGQVIIKKAVQVYSQFASALLTGDFDQIKNAKLQKQSEWEYVLTPSAGAAGDVLRAQLTLDQKAWNIQKIVLFHEGGNVSEIELSKVKLGVSLSKTHFVFQVPPKTDRIEDF